MDAGGKTPEALQEGDEWRCVRVCVFAAQVSGGGGGGGVTNWTADPAIFPSGMAAIDKALGGMPMVMHNRQWSPRSDYIHNLSFSWEAGGASGLCHGQCPWAVPDDPSAFFTWFFQQQPGWGLTMYEQDWMCTECAWRVRRAHHPAGGAPRSCPFRPAAVSSQ